MRRVLAGQFAVINRHLLQDLIAKGLWSDAMRQTIMANNGSVQGIDAIPEDMRNLYKTAYEIKQKVLIDMAADRGAFICQSQSLNLFTEEITTSKLSSMHFYGWKRGLKTGMYYLRTRPATEAIKFTLSGSGQTESRVRGVEGVPLVRRVSLCSAYNVAHTMLQ